MLVNEAIGFVSEIFRKEMAPRRGLSPVLKDMGQMRINFQNHTALNTWLKTSAGTKKLRSIPRAKPTTSGQQKQ